MVKKKTQSKLAGLAKKTGVRKETRHRAPEPPKGGSKLPPDMDGAIAELRKLEIKTVASGKNKGELALYADGTCITPKEHHYEEADSKGRLHKKTAKTEGALVQIPMIVLADQTFDNGDTVSAAERFDQMENTLKLLGLPTEDWDDDDLEDNINNYLKDCEKADEKVYFQFRTYKNTAGYIRTVLEGLAPEDFDPDEDYDEEVEDATEDEEEGDGETEVSEDEGDEEEEEDIAVLGKSGDKGDEDAQLRLTELATEAGYDANDYEYWKDVAEVLLSGDPEEEEEGGDEEEEGDGEEEEEDDEAEDFEPEKTDVYGYKPRGAKAPKECEVVKVVKTKKVCDLKCLETGKVYKSIPWASLTDL